MTEDEQNDNLRVRRFIDEALEEELAVRPRPRITIAVKDKRINKYRFSRHQIAEVMPIHFLATLFHPDFHDDPAQDEINKESRKLLINKIIYAIERHGMKYAYVPDTSIPFANLDLKHKRLAEISIQEFIRIYQTGRLYFGAECHIQIWQEALVQANEESRIIKEVNLLQSSPPPAPPPQKKNAYQLEKEKYRRAIYQEVTNEMGVSTKKGILVEEAAKRAECSEKMIREALKAGE